LQRSGRKRWHTSGRPTDNGDITIEVPLADDDYKVDASSDNGHVQVAVPTDPQAQRTINAESGNGSVRVRYPAG